ncbi:hypothetical protein A2U01_0074518, partial [Trifolium medium]|nr:hypothetical protein [Trifolium medium]
ASNSDDQTDKNKVTGEPWRAPATSSLSDQHPRSARNQKSFPSLSEQYVAQRRELRIQAQAR